MHRIDGPGATVDKKFTEGDPVGGVAATVVTAAWMNDVQEELLSVLVAAGIMPVKGTQDQVLKAIRAVSSGLIGVRTFTSSGTFTPTPGAKRAVVEIVGGGGGGGGMAATGAGACGAGGGGAGGTYGLLYISSGLVSVSMTVGGGGAGGTGLPGSAGSASSFGAFMTCPGGGGGNNGSGVTGPSVTGSPGAAGGIATGALISVQSSGAGPGISLSATSVLSGAGGATRFGFGGAPSGLNAASGISGNAGLGAGAGGSGAAAVATGSSVTGGAGASGQIVVYEYY